MKRLGLLENEVTPRKIPLRQTQILRNTESHGIHSTVEVLVPCCMCVCGGGGGCMCVCVDVAASLFEV